ncbi:MAG: HAD family phosphatase [Clostridia bacterium]|nr:HAD family phosphatase [Clostridia bacterium]
MKLNGVIFDLDGTLIDSMYIWDDLSYDLLCANGITPKDDLRDKVSTMYLEESSRYVIEEYGLPCTVEEVNRYINERVENFYLHEVLPKQDILPFLERLKAAGIPMCVATATERKLAVPALEHNGMLGYFSEILTCREIGQNKNDPLIFEEALRRLGTEKNGTVIFEDSLHAVSTAKAAGFPAFTIFDKSSARNKEKLMALSDRFFYRYEELNGCFENL